MPRSLISLTSAFGKREREGRDGVGEKWGGEGWKKEKGGWRR